VAGEGDKLLFVFDGGHLTDEQLAAIRFPDGAALDTVCSRGPRLMATPIRKVRARRGPLQKSARASPTPQPPLAILSIHR
jgi:hypothetical protein